MTVWVRFEDKKTLNWLSRLIEAQIVKAEADPSRYCDVYESLMTSVKSLNDYHSPDDVVRVIKAEKATQEPEAKKAPTNPKIDTGLCSTHKSYQAKRAPRTDCQSCWDAFKKFEPMVYPKARRNFERKTADK